MTGHRTLKRSGEVPGQRGIPAQLGITAQAGSRLESLMIDHFVKPLLIIILSGFLSSLGFDALRYIKSPDMFPLFAATGWYVGGVLVLAGSYIGFLYISYQLQEREWERNRSAVSRWQITTTADGFNRHVAHDKKMLTIGFDTQERLMGWAYNARLDEISKREMMQRYVEFFAHV